MKQFKKRVIRKAMRIVCDYYYVPPKDKFLAPLKFKAMGVVKTDHDAFHLAEILQGLGYVEPYPAKNIYWVLPTSKGKCFFEEQSELRKMLALKSLALPAAVALLSSLLAIISTNITRGPLIQEPVQQNMTQIQCPCQEVHKQEVQKEYHDRQRIRLLDPTPFPTTRPKPFSRVEQPS